MRIFKIQQNNRIIPNSQIAFTGEFDKYAYISRQIEQERINNIKRKYEAKRSYIDQNVKQNNNKLQALKRKINNLQATISSNNRKIEDLQQQSQNILETIKKTKEEIKLFNDKNLQLLNTYLKEKQSIDSEIENDKVRKIKNTQETFMQDLSMIKTGPKKLLIEEILNPILMSYETDLSKLKNVSIGTEALNSDEQKTAKNAIFSWITTKTDANYAQLDVNKFNSQDDFVNALRKISLIASRDYEENGNLSVTLIENLGTLKLENLDETNLNFLKELLSREGDKTPNILILVGNLLSKELKNSISINIDKNFLNNQRVGLQSLLKDIINKQPKGINLIKRI